MLRACGHDAEADRPAVVLGVKAEAAEALLIEEMLDDFGKMVEGVCELAGSGASLLPKPG